jgi:4-oxalomesaconate hydratase
MKILVFSAHAADFCTRAGGTIAKHVQNGDTVYVIALSDGERSESGGLYQGDTHPSLDEVKAIRREEAANAAAILGAGIDFLGWNDLSFDYSVELVRQLAEFIRAFSPDALLSHHGPDPVSMDHERTWQLVVNAMQAATAPGLESDYSAVPRLPLFFFEATVPLTELEGFNPDFYVDVTDTWDVKLQALQAFQRAQPFLEPWYTDVAKHRAAQARFITGSTTIEYAEAFERMWPWVGQSLPLHEL